jgi:hypothetical protein
VGRAFAGILILWGVLNVLSGNWLGGVWIGLIGLFLSNAAQASYQQVLVHDALEGEPVRRFMNPDPITVSPSLDLRRWVNDFVYRYHRKTFPVVSEGRLQGWIGTRALSRVPRGEWGRHTVGKLMRTDLSAIDTLPRRTRSRR